MEYEGTIGVMSMIGAFYTTDCLLRLISFVWDFDVLYRTERRNIMWMRQWENRTRIY